MIDATLHQVGRNARTQDFDSDHKRAQDEEQQSARLQRYQDEPGNRRGAAGNDLSTCHRSLEWQAMQFYG
jgi:hypothetical protein